MHTVTCYTTKMIILEIQVQIRKVFVILEERKMHRKNEYEYIMQGADTHLYLHFII